MKKKVPFEISEFIEKHFKEGFISDIKVIKDKNNKTVYKVDVTTGDDNNHLKFNEKGRLLKDHTEPIFDEDYYEGPYFGKKESEGE